MFFREMSQKKIIETLQKNVVEYCLECLVYLSFYNANFLYISKSKPRIGEYIYVEVIDN